ncbi:patatin-like phospholipase family protein [Rhodopseudomonas palustris]
MQSPPDRPDSSLRNARRVLVLQGGGALGSYQAGAYQALCHHDFEPQWLAGISIGAINAAIIAGNPREQRVDKLKQFWEMASSPVPWQPMLHNDHAHSLFNEASAAVIAAFGVPGFFTPRFPPSHLMPTADPEVLSYYDTSPLRSTLERLVDFDRLNTNGIRLSVGAVNVVTGNFEYFDNTRQTIGPEHIMASAALPPGFPAIEIDGHYYWDGGVASNTPLDYVLESEDREDLLIFQVDLFSAHGRLPQTLLEAAEREKDIRFSSRTRLNTDKNKQIHNIRKTLRHLMGRLPDELRDDPAYAILHQAAKENAVTLVHLIYRKRDHEASSKDYDFSRLNMIEHWKSGEQDVYVSMRHEEWQSGPQDGETMVTWDLTRDAIK